MKKADLVKLIENLKDDEDINEVLKGTDVEETFKKLGQDEGLTLENFKTKVKSDKDFKSYIDSINDSYHAKAIKTMKEKGSWEGEFADVLKAKYPNLITDPKEKEMIDLKKELEDMKAEQARTLLLKDAVKYAGEKKVPSDFVEKFLGDDLDSTKANLDAFSEQWSKALQTAVESKIKDSSYTPPGGDDGKLSVGASFAQKANKSNIDINDPWSVK